MTLTEDIRRKALELGFVKFGVARADALADESVRLQEWLHRGYHASMEWMGKNSDKRMDPRVLVPGARSVIVVAENYFVPTAHHPSADEGKISRYAWGDDYHLHTTTRIQSLFDCITQAAPEMDGRYYVDTGPVMEKAWAARAGLGWQGKHTNLITKDYGSWVFLGTIITTLELEYDEPIGDWCGTCTACIDACPTDAIVEPYVVDAAKCISYQTIEHRGPIDDALGAQFEGWVYGCDICQDVCPWNRFAQATSREEYAPRPGNVTPRLDELIGMTQEEFSRRFAKSAIKRTKRAGLKRNAELIKKNTTKNK
jgi:epoxyqueuosine reductase